MPEKIQTIEHIRPPFAQEAVASLGGVALLEHAGQLPEGGVLTDLIEQAKRQRESILSLPSWEEGLNMGRVNSFCDRQGFPQKSLRVLTPEDYKKAIEIIGGSEQDFTDTDGRFLPLHDVIIIKRDPETEALNGVEHTESTIVHERAHTATKLVSLKARAVSARSGPLRLKASTKIEAVTERMGFETTVGMNVFKGKVLEEGFAELKRGTYITEEIGMPNGFVGAAETGAPNPINKYMRYIKQSDGRVAKTYLAGAVPAVLLELLRLRDSGIEEVLKEGRQSEHGLGELEKRLNSIRANLYRDMVSIELDSKDGQNQVLGLLFTLQSQSS